MQSPPRVNAHPWLETLSFLRSPPRFAEERQRRLGDVFVTNILGRDTLYVLAPEAAQWVFAGEDRYLQNEWTPQIRALLGAECLAMLTGPEHRARRKMLSPHFKRGSMGDVIAPIEAITARHLARWASGPQPMVIERAMRSLAFEIAATYILGTELTARIDLDELSEIFTTWVAGMFAAPIDLPFTTFGRALRARRELQERLRALVDERGDEGGGGGDVLATMLAVRDEEGRALSRAAIVDELQLLLFAGHDTTVTALTNVLLHLSQHPGYLARAREEVDHTAGSPLDLAALERLPYLMQVLHESMRVVPPIGGMFRRTIEACEYGGYAIDAGWRVALSPGASHASARHWPDPARFDPERFARVRGESERVRAYIPFGGGPRICLGQHFALVEMHVVLALILRGYEWALVPRQDLTLRTLPFPLPRSGLIVRFGARSDR